MDVSDKMKAINDAPMPPPGTATSRLDELAQSVAALFEYRDQLLAGQGLNASRIAALEDQMAVVLVAAGRNSAPTTEQRERIAELAPLGPIAEENARLRAALTKAHGIAADLLRGLRSEPSWEDLDPTADLEAIVDLCVMEDCDAE